MEIKIKKGEIKKITIELEDPLNKKDKERLGKLFSQKSIENINEFLSKDDKIKFDLEIRNVVDKNNPEIIAGIWFTFRTPEDKFISFYIKRTEGSKIELIKN